MTSSLISPPPSFEKGDAGISKESEAPDLETQTTPRIDDPFTTRRGRIWFFAALGAVVLIGIVLRFWTRSDLWLDEALTVNIARQPLSQIPHLLREDGAPPLFYVLLHVWMGIFGQSDLAVRSLSGVLSLVTVPLGYLAGRRLGGRWIGWIVVLLLASSPFAVRYATETRMYTLVCLLTVLGFLAVDNALRRPRPGNLCAVAAITGLLLYSHYWSIYLLGTVGLWLAYSALFGRPEWRRGARAALVAECVGGLTFLPWVPIFLFQSAHTGTPWAAPADFSAMVNAVASFAGGGDNQGRALALIMFAMAGLAVFGLASDRSHIDLYLKGRPWGRPLGAIIVGTLALAIVGGQLSTSAFQVRYASVVFVPLVVLVALGFLTLRDVRVSVVVLTAAVIAGLFGSFPNISTNRTQAGQVARAIERSGRPGDYVAYCPDQLGPAVYRLLPSGRYTQVTFPRGTSPEFINWIDYAKASKRGMPAKFAVDLEAKAAATHSQIFLVWAPGYQTFGVKCEGILQTLGGDKNLVATSLVNGKSTIFQPMWLERFSPVS